MWDHDTSDEGHERWRNVLQAVGATIGIGISLHYDRGLIIFAVIGAIYGTLLAGLCHQLREVARGDRANALLLLSGYLGAGAGFTYFFFLSGTDCGIARLLFSPVYAAGGWVVGAALGWAAGRGIA